MSAQISEIREKALAKLQKDINQDPRREERLTKQFCKKCFYSTRLAGRAITHSNCMGCNKEQVFSSIDIDSLCLDCAKEKNLCAHCAKDIDSGTTLI